MNTNDSNIKPQQTGGLRLMTVFIAVLALHVVVIGGFTAYHLMSGGSTDADITTTDKTHKDAKAADGTAIADTAPATPSVGDKTAPTPSSTSDTAPSPGGTTASGSDQITTTEVTAPTPTRANTAAPTAAVVMAPTPAPANSVVPSPATAAPLVPAPTLTLNAPKVGLLTPPSDPTAPTSQTPSGPITSNLAPPPDVTAPLAAGPVHMPSQTETPGVAKVQHDHQQIYTVKITDSYKKIAKAHHITVAQLKEANHIKGDTLHTGQKLTIPSNGSIVATTTSATPTETNPTRTVLRESSSSTDSLSASPTSEASAGLHHHMYTVAKGDTLAKIAHRFKTTPLAIMEVNDIADPAKLTIGKKLKIPSKESRSAKNTPIAPVAPAATPVAQPSEVQVKEQPTEATGELANFSL
jgi:LysM repeat protein